MKHRRARTTGPTEAGNITMMNAYTKFRAGMGGAALAAALIASVGCTSISDWKPSTKIFSMDSTWPFKDKDKPHEGKPVKMVCTWTDTVMTTAGQKPQRGFGGRIMFYEKDEKKPILVDGQLVVYAFDETGRAQTDNKPTRRYVFPTEQVPLHMSKSELGASYSFWLPWDEAGGPRTEVGLICRFEPKGGAVVTSEQAKQTLPGTEPVQVAAGTPKAPKLPEGVLSKPPAQTLQSLQQQRNEQMVAKQANYEAPINGDPQAASANMASNGDMLPSKRLTATTITLPNNFEMPSAAALAAQSQSVQGRSGLQPYLGQPVLQQTPASAAAMQQTANPPFGLNRAMVGTQPAPTNAASQVALAPMQPLIQTPGGFHTTSASTGPTPPQQLSNGNQQASIQELLQQQQALQQKLQQLQTASALNGAPQMATQLGGTGSVSYPAAGASLR
ncbi:MAG TPA: hypothetical protein VH107_04945 [Lacipirellulaceae bacterium]|nr:hypothetical protein [Lacipirellulaceae bacterium]